MQIAEKALMHSADRHNVVSYGNFDLTYDASLRDNLRRPAAAKGKHVLPGS
jgi:hypothetical protein